MFPFQLNLPEQGTSFHFKDHASLLVFLERENDFLRWTQSIKIPYFDPHNGSTQDQRARKTVLAKLEAIDALRSSAAIDGSGVSDQLQNIYGGNGFIISRSPRGEFVESIREYRSAEVAFGALVTFLGLPCFMAERALVEGAYLALNFDNLDTRKASNSAKATINAAAARSERAAADADAAVLRMQETAQLLSRNMVTAGRRSRDRQVRRFQRGHDARIQSIEATERHYKEELKLKSSVTYWSDKSSKHRSTSWLMTRISLGYATAVSVVVGLGGFVWLPSRLDKLAQGPQQIQVGYLLISVSIALLTIMFWVGRVISRLYLSERHMASDAEERAVMAQTYLALATDDLVAEGDRALVLTALFRSGSDGIVRDDAAPDISLAGILSRFGASSSPAR